jgi:hypothetical protein
MPRELCVWRADIYDYIRSVMSLQGGLSVERMCLLTGLSRAGFYRHLRTADHWEEEVEVRSQVQKIVLEHLLISKSRLSASDGRIHQSAISRAFVERS